MVDIYRTITDLRENVFQDEQPNESISARDARDLIVSLGLIPYGSIYTLTPVETIISSAGVYVKGLCTTQINNMRQFDTPTNNRLRYTGTVPYHMHIVCTISMTSVGNQNLASFKLYYFDDSVGSGAVIDGSVVNRFISVGADEGSAALHWDLVMEKNDYLELWVANLTDTGNITVSHLYLFAMGMAM